MRLNYRDEFVCLGNIEINAVSQVTELDSRLVTGPSTYQQHADRSTTACHSYDSIQMIEKQLAIIVPCMNEELHILQGVLRGIPHHCSVVLVSNSTSANYEAERVMLKRFRDDTQRNAVIMHQTDQILACAFSAAGMPHIVDHDQDGTRRIHSGKGEAMMIGTVLAKLAGKQFVGFIDADNFVPGAVHEYCKVYATGLYHTLDAPSFGLQLNNDTNDEPPLAMVRIKWQSKPKIVDGKLVPQESGRCSRTVNAWMNRLLSSTTGNDGLADFVKTANAGEHAMSTELALKLHFATGYAVEPYQLIDLLERSGALPPTPPDSPHRSAISNEESAPQATLGRKVKVMQIGTLNPHIHDFGKGEEHIARMQGQGLSTIFHSRLASKELKDDLQEYVEKELKALVGQNGVLSKAREYPPLEDINFTVFKKVLSYLSFQRGATVHMS